MKYLDEKTAYCLIQQLQERMEALRMDRQSWFVHWGQLAEMYLPRRYRWLISPSQWNRGSQINAGIVDATGLLAARTCASGFMAGMTSPTKIWFNIGLKGVPTVPFGPAKDWLDDCRNRLLSVMAQSNFYTSLAQLYLDEVVFSTATMLIYEDAEQVIRCHNPCAGEYFLATSDRQFVDSFYREFTFTARQCVQQFGLENCSESVQMLARTGRGSQQQEIVVCHAIEPNTRLWENNDTPLAYAVPASFPYREVYWEKAQPNNKPLKTAGYHECPFIAPRWAVTGNDSYGSMGPGMDALGDTRQLQIEQRRKGEAIEKLVRPPMVGSANMRNEPASILAGGVTYVPELGPNTGFKPAFQVDPRIQELMQDIMEVQNRIEKIFYVDLFLMIASLDTVRTATEIDARREEKIIQLGPVIERFENEALDPLIERIFSIMLRRGLFAEPPPELEGMTIDIQYISMLAEAQRAARTAGTERVLALAGNLAGVDPSAMDVLDTDALISDYADSLNVTPLGIRSEEEIAQLRAQRQEQQQAQAAAEQAQQLAAGAKTLSDTQVGGGQNALELMQSGLA